LARLAEIGLLPQIELSGAQAFLATSQAAVVSDAVEPAEWYRLRVQQGLVWVAAENDHPIGFASTEPFEDALHLWELVVQLDAQQRGAGRALVEAVAADARARGLPAVTLTTFRDVAFNAPFYARLGFEQLDLARLNPRLVAVRENEAKMGLDMPNRCAMRLGV
jgi:N-acetylglutamate synthase-like GNAT family acetyltransferase